MKSLFRKIKDVVVSSASTIFEWGKSAVRFIFRKPARWVVEG